MARWYLELKIILTLAVAISSMIVCAVQAQAVLDSNLNTILKHLIVVYAICLSAGCLANM